jgi:hypothetical protein
LVARNGTAVPRESVRTDARQGLLVCFLQLIMLVPVAESSVMEASAEDC